MATQPEPWLRGPVPGLDPRLSPILYTFQQAREDLLQYVGPLTPGQIWATPHGLGSVGFHIRHIAGSTDRLMSYLEGRALTPDQMEFLRSEEQPGSEGSEELLAQMDKAFQRAEATVRALDPA